MKIGNMEIGITKAKVEYTDTEDKNTWISGELTAETTANIGGQDHTRNIKIEVGCWADTNDDYAEWAAWQEGARLIAAALGAPTPTDMRGTPIQHAFDDAAGDLGYDICALLRRAAKSEDQVAYAE